MHALAERIVNYMIENGVASSEMREMDVYGFEVLIGKVLNYGTLLLLALIHHNVIEMLLFMAVFFSLRSRTGGYHAKKPLYCYFGTLIIYFAVSNAAVPVLLGRSYLVTGLVAVSALVIVLLAPVNHPNLDLSEEEIEKCRSASGRMAIFVSICILILVWLNIIPEYTVYLAAGIGADAGLLLIAKIVKQEVQKE